MTQEVYIYWQTCTECHTKRLAHGRVKCPDCDCRMTPAAIAGQIEFEEGEIPE